MTTAIYLHSAQPGRMNLAGQRETVQELRPRTRTGHHRRVHRHRARP